MDFDDFDEPVQAPTKAKRFAPKGSKLKPQPETKAKPQQPQPSVPLPKTEAKIDVVVQEEVDIKPKVDVVSNPEPSVADEAVKMEIDYGSGAVNSDSGGVNDNEDEDMIVREIDVCFTPSINPNTKLYVLQYPLRPCWRPYELEERCEEVRVKPATAEVEMDLSIDNSANWDSEVASRMKITKQTLATTWRPPHTSGYVVGVLMGDKLHLSPIHAVVQLRPSQKWKSSTNDAEIVVKTEGSLPPKKQKNQTQSTSEVKPGPDESWTPLKYHGPKSDLSSSYLEQIVAGQSSTIDFAMNPLDYMSSLCPGSSHDKKPKGPSKRLLLSLPIEERIKKLLLEGPTIQRFNALKCYASDCSNEDVLNALQKYGMLVQGHWVPKTSLLFQDADQSEKIKLPARDYVLSVFSKSLVMNSSHLNIPVRLKDVVLKILPMYAVERKFCHDWKFKEQPDSSFLRLHPDIVKKQEEIWNKIEENLAGHFNRPQKSVAAVKNAPEKSNVAHKPVNPVNSSEENTAKTRNTLIKRTMADETRECLRKVLLEVFQNHKVCSLKLIREELDKLAVTKTYTPKADALMAVTAAKSSQEALLEVVSEVATNVHGSYVLKASPEHPEYNSLRKIVIDLLLARGPNAKLKKSDVCEAAMHVLKREVPLGEYQKVMADICDFKGAAWILKSGDRTPS